MGSGWGPLVAIGLLTGGATLFGGTLALRFRSGLGLFLGFSSGAVIAVSLLDLLPEAFEAARGMHDSLSLTSTMAVGFAVYLVLDRVPLLLAKRPRKGASLGPASLTAHSLMDGLGIGVAFQASPSIGWVVAIAVLAHDLLDGANTVTLSLGVRGDVPVAKRWLVADALAPMVGIVVSQMVAIPRSFLSILLALFAGFFLYIGASELLPRSQNGRPNLSTVAATVLGMIFIYVVVRTAAL